MPYLAILIRKYRLTATRGRISVSMAEDHVSASSSDDISTQEHEILPAFQWAKATALLTLSEGTSLRRHEDILASQWPRIIVQYPHPTVAAWRTRKTQQSLSGQTQDFDVAI